MTRLGVIALFVLAVSACGGSSSQYAAAAATLGAGVAGAGLYRATTGGCWGQCLDGMVCDRPSGRCVRIEEREDPRAPHMVRVDCLPEEPECAASSTKAPSAKAEAELARELIDVLVAAPPVELRGHSDPGCAALADAAKSKTLAQVLEELHGLAEQRASCASAQGPRRCLLTLRRSDSQDDAPGLELRFDVHEKNGVKELVVATLACSLAR